MNFRKSMIAAMSGAAALAMAAGASDAADLEQVVHDPAWAATIQSGYQWSDISDFPVDLEGFFGEAAVLRNFGGGLNVQGDFAFYNHDFTGKGSGKSVDAWHSGGILFWRDSNMGLFGIDAAFGQNDLIFGLEVDTFRVGGRGEFFVNDMITLGGGIGYHNLDLDFAGKTIDGLNANVFANFYVTEQLAVKGKFDYAGFDISNTGGKSFDAISFTGEVEYLLSEITGTNTSIFAGGRYTEYDFSDGGGNLEIAQGFVGVRHYFVTGGSLANNHRTNTLDNTNTILEKAPFPGFF
ncbi:MAG: hypothetical protein WBD37_02840 [Anderseniella sp.]